MELCQHRSVGGALAQTGRGALPEAWEILGNPERTQEYLKRYGITRDAVVAEMERVVDHTRKTV